MALGEIDTAASRVRESLELAHFELKGVAWRALQRVATIAALRGQPRNAARLNGFVDAWRIEQGHIRAITEEFSYNTLLASLQAVLTPDGIADLGALGARLTVEQAFEMVFDLLKST